MLIRHAGTADARDVADVEVASRQQAYRGLVPDERLDRLTPEARAADWAQVLAAADPPRRTLLIAEDGGRAVGIADLCPATDPDRDPSTTAEIASLYVVPARWRSGVGRQLMATALAVLAEAGYADVVLWVLETNRPAAEFYARSGWELDGAGEDTVVSGQPIRYVRYHLPRGSTAPS